MTGTSIREFITALHATKEIMSDRVAAGRARLTSLEIGGDPSERSRITTEKRDLANELERQSAVLHRIDAALMRAQEGTFGTCSDCEEPIVERRLRAQPWSERCISCQERHEADGELTQYGQALPGEPRHV